MNVVVETIGGGHTLSVSAGKATTTVDRSGNAEAVGFHSVDLLLAGLGSCMIGTMLSAAERESIAVTDARVELRPLVALGPERVSRIRMKMSVSGDISDDQLRVLKAAAESCKVHNSLHHGVETELDLIADAKAPASNAGSELHV
jgi:putative redox protein